MDKGRGGAHNLVENGERLSVVRRCAPEQSLEAKRCVEEANAPLVVDAVLEEPDVGVRSVIDPDHGVRQRIGIPVRGAAGGQPEVAHDVAIVPAVRVVVAIAVC